MKEGTKGNPPDGLEKVVADRLEKLKLKIIAEHEGREIKLKAREELVRIKEVELAKGIQPVSNTGYLEKIKKLEKENVNLLSRADLAERKVKEFCQYSADEVAKGLKPELKKLETYVEEIKQVLGNFGLVGRSGHVNIPETLRGIMDLLEGGMQVKVKEPVGFAKDIGNIAVTLQRLEGKMVSPSIQAHEDTREDMSSDREVVNMEVESVVQGVKVDKFDEVPLDLSAGKKVQDVSSLGTQDDKAGETGDKASKEMVGPLPEVKQAGGSDLSWVDGQGE